jgi:hypothetical protein
MQPSKAGTYPSGVLEVLHFKAGFWPNPQTVDKTGKACRDKHANLFGSCINYV